jgi:glucan phosphoethanolaminetransferase (alkaline phosphatase superfamily)
VVLTTNLRRIIMNESIVGLKENRVGFFAGLAGGFGFYISWMILVMLWQTTTSEEAAMKSVIGFILGLVVGVLLYLAVYLGVNKKLEGTRSKHLTRDSILGIVAGLLIAFLIGLLFYNPTGVGFTPPFG